MKKNWYLLFSFAFLVSCQTIQANQPTVLPTGFLPTNAALTPIPASTSDLIADICLPTNVKIEYGDSSVKYQSVTMSIVLTNLDSTSCLVPFFPNARLLDAAGKPLKVSYHFFKDQFSNSYLLVEPGHSVGFLLVWKNWCQPPLAGGVKIQLTLSEATLPIDVPTGGTDLEKSTIYTRSGCTQPGKESEVWISQFVYDVPVPLYP